MFVTYPYWDVSYLVAVIFTLGSVVWCLNGFFAWLPLQDPSTEFPGEIPVGGGVTAFLGATIFEFGSILLMIEAVNENRSDCFGWALEEALEEKGLMRMRPSHAACKHHHHDKHRLLGHSKASEGILTLLDQYFGSNSWQEGRHSIFKWDPKITPTRKMLAPGLGSLLGMNSQHITSGKLAF